MNVTTPLFDFLSLFGSVGHYLRISHRQPDNLTALKKMWAQDFLTKLNVQTTMINTPSLAPSTLFVGNHISYLDIPLLMAHVDGISFVAKKEVSHWPLIGYGAKKVDTVFVKRESKNSRQQARETIKASLREGKRIAIFPSGTTCTEEAKPWRHGAFEIAADTGCAVVPFRINYQPLRKVAYINKDFLPVHLFQICQMESIQAELEFHPPVKITNPEVDCQHWYNWSREKLISR